MNLMFPWFVAITNSSQISSQDNFHVRLIKAYLSFLVRGQFSAITDPKCCLSKILEPYHMITHFIGTLILIQNNMLS